MRHSRWLIFWLICVLRAVNAFASEAPESPRLRALAAAVDAHDAGAVARFWTEIDAAHSPLIEPVPDHPDEVRFTFLFRTDPQQVALNVQLNGWFPLHAQ